MPNINQILLSCYGAPVGAKSRITAGFGYFAGGVNTSYIATNGISEFSFTVEAINAMSATLATARERSGGCSGSVNGYFLGGSYINQGTSYAEIDGLAYASKTSINPSSALPVGRAMPSGTQNSLKGFITGGSTGTPVVTGAVYVKTIGGFIFSTETYGDISAVLGIARRLASAASSGLKAYTYGGYAYVAGANRAYSAIDALTYSTETNAAIAATLSSQRSSTVSVDSLVNNYVVGGTTTIARVRTIDRHIYSTEACNLIAASLAVGRTDVSGTPSDSKGYIAGGVTTTSSVATISALTFDTETCVDLSATLPTVLFLQTGVTQR